MEVLVGQVCLGGLWNSAVYGKMWKRGFSTGPSWTALLNEFWYSGSDHVPVVWFHRGKEFWFWVLFDVMTCGFVLLSLKNNSVSC